MKCHVVSCDVMFRRRAPLRLPRRSAARLHPHIVPPSRSARRRRLACGASLFRAYRVCAGACVRAGAVRAPPRARPPVSRPFRWGFFAARRETKRPRMPLPPAYRSGPSRFVPIRAAGGLPAARRKPLFRAYRIAPPALAARLCAVARLGVAVPAGRRDHARASQAQGARPSPVRSVGGFSRRCIARRETKRPADAASS